MEGSAVFFIVQGKPIYWSGAKVDADAILQFHGCFTAQDRTESTIAITFSYFYVVVRIVPGPDIRKMWASHMRRRQRR